MKPSRGLRDLDLLGNHKHPCASRAGVYIGFRGYLNPVDPSVSSYNLYLCGNLTLWFIECGGGITKPDSGAGAISLVPRPEDEEN